MKSKLADAVCSGMPSGEEWKKCLFDSAELCGAIEDDNITGLVREVLRPTYGGMRVFEPLVAYTAISVRKAVAVAYLKGVGDRQLCILCNHTQVEREEKSVRERESYADSMPKYWVGDGAMIKDWREELM